MLTVPKTPHERLRFFRKCLHLSQIDFARRIDLAQTTLSQLELGSHELKGIHLHAMKSAFSLNPEWMMSGDGEMFSDRDFLFFEDYARINDLSKVESDIIKGILLLDGEYKKRIFEYNQIAASREDFAD